MHDYTLHNYSRARRSVRSTLNPPALRPPGERRRAESCLRNPAGGSCPGSASPAEATTLCTFFSFFFRLEISCPKSSSRPPQETSRGPQNCRNLDLLLKKSSPGPQFYRFFRRSMFFTLFGSIFGSFFMKNRGGKQ